MAKYRYTITLTVDKDEFTSEMAELFRKELEGLTEAQDFECDNIKVKCEDEYCIRHNDKIRREKENELPSNE